MLFLLSNLHMNNLSNDIVSSFADVVLLSFITLIDAKTWAYKLNSNFKNKSEWTLCHFMNWDLNKQAQALEVTFSKKAKSDHSLTCFNNIYIKNLSEWEIEFLSSYYGISIIIL